MSVRTLEQAVGGLISRRYKSGQEASSLGRRCGRSRIRCRFGQCRHDQQSDEQLFYLWPALRCPGRRQPDAIYRPGLYRFGHGPVDGPPVHPELVNLASLYAVVYTWNGTSPGTELWRSATLTGTPQGLLDFTPTGIQLTQGQGYVAFLSTYGIAGNSGLAYIGDCLPFGGACNSNSIPNLGDVVIGNVQGANLDEVNFSHLNYHDLTFSATITPVPEAATWAMMLAGFGAVGVAMRRRRTAVSFA